MIRYALKPCEPCGRDQPHTKRGCIVCGKRTRLAKRLAKSSLLGSGLAHAKKLLKTADDLFSVWLRAKHETCEMCGLPFEPGEMQAAHGISRGAHVIRFDEDNVFSLCAADHRRHTPPRSEWEEWRLKRLGRERFDRIALMDRARGKLGSHLYPVLIAEFERRIDALPAGARQEWAAQRKAAILARVPTMGVRLIQVARIDRGTGAAVAAAFLDDGGPCSTPSDCSSGSASVDGATPARSSR